MTRLAVATLCILALLAGGAWAATPAELLGAYVAQREATLAAAAERIADEGPGTPAARMAAEDAGLHLAALADALRESTRDAPGPAAEAVAAHLAADEELAPALADHAAGRIDADALAARVAAIGDGAADESAGVPASGGGMGALDIVQAVGGPLLLIAVVALTAWRRGPRRRAPSPR